MLNEVSLIGRLGDDPERKYTPNGKAVSNMSIGITKTWKDPSGKKNEDTTWVRVIFWGKQAETLCEYSRKGDELWIRGELKNRSWEKDGVKKYTTEVNGERFIFLRKSVKNQQQQAPQRQYNPQPTPPDPASHQPPTQWQVQTHPFMKQLQQQQQEQYTQDNIPF